MVWKDLMKLCVLIYLMWVIGNTGVVNFINPAIIKDMPWSFVLHKKAVMSQLSVRKIIFHYKCC